jgi:hypothetical protein
VICAAFSANFHMLLVLIRCAMTYYGWVRKLCVCTSSGGRESRAAGCCCGQRAAAESGLRRGWRWSWVMVGRWLGLKVDRVGGNGEPETEGCKNKRLSHLRLRPRISGVRKEGCRIAA